MKPPLLAAGFALVLTACQWPVADQFNNPEDRKAPSSVTYTLSLTHGLGGTISPPGPLVVNKGKATAIAAQADDGFSFVNWTVPSGSDVTFGNAANSSTTVALNLGDATVKANFGPITITTVAGYGGGTPSGDGGPATMANFQVQTLTCDTKGHLYIGDLQNGMVRNVDLASGIIRNAAGDPGIRGTFSGDGGPSTSAGLNWPFGIVFNSDGDLYVADSLNYRIRKVSAQTGIISTVFGDGNAAYHGDGGPAVSARGYPMDMALDSLENVYFRDNSRIRKIDVSTGIVTTVAGNGTGTIVDGVRATTSGLNPWAIALDHSDNLYIAESGTTLRRVDAATGIITTVVGTGTMAYNGEGRTALATNLSVHGAVFDKVGNIYISDADNNRVRKVSASTGLVTTIAGSGIRGSNGDGGAAVLAELEFESIAIDGQGNLYLGDKNRVRKIPGKGSGVGP